ncbi:hypothetical protein FACS189487_03410 [Campylobacterota bacterium]|nr:hypothetical protein FACS189487_03410 [Campylobacterota bacterium]
MSDRRDCGFRRNDSNRPIAPLFAVDRAGIFAKVKEAERGATGVYCTVNDQAPSEDDAEIGEKTKRETQKG